MAFNVNEFITGYMERDGYRPNLFDVWIKNIPNLNFPLDFPLKAKASSLPASTIGTARVGYFGRNAKFAGNRSFSNWTTTFVLDENDFAGSSGAFTVYGIRASFERWSAKINKHIGNTRNSNQVDPVNYFSNLQVNLYGKDGGIPIQNYIIYYAFPVSISPIQLDWGANDRIAEFSVTFAYQWWEKYNALSQTSIRL